MFPSFATDSVTRIRAAVVDDGHGNETADWEHASEQAISNVVVQPGTSVEYLVGRDTTLIQWTVLAQAGTDIDQTDRVRYRGIVYEVDGAPGDQPSPTGALNHVVILLKTYVG